jgi:two-component system NarL family sensor kinase
MRMRWGRRRPARRPVLEFALTGLIGLLLVGLAAAYFVRRAGVSEAVRQARDISRLIAAGVVEPNLTNAIVTGDPAAVSRLDRVIRTRVKGVTSVVRVKVWTPQGRIVYSDEPRLIGVRYPLDEDDVEALRTGRIAANLSDLSAPENRFERSYGKLLQVYVPVRTPNGSPLLFESYLRFSSVTADASRLLRTVAPAVGAALVVIWLLQLPLAWSLVSRLRQGQREREQLLLRAIEASDLERRRIAADLHDGVVQDLAGISMTLAAAAERGAANGGGADVGTLREAATVTRESMRSLRSLLVEIYPPTLQNAGLGSALSDLVAPLRARGITAHVEVEPGVETSPDAEKLIFRTAQEAVRNVVSHSGAQTVDVSVNAQDGRVRLVVRDDGRGFDAAVAERRREEGHLGLSLLADRARELGGELTIESEPGAGTTLALEVPRS